MVKLMTLYEELKKAAAFREMRLKTTLQFVRRARQNVALNVLSLQSYIITLQSFHGARFIPLHPLFR
jgi:hypothetical protein